MADHNDTNGPCINCALRHAIQETYPDGLGQEEHLALMESLADIVGWGMAIVGPKTMEAWIRLMKNEHQKHVDAESTGSPAAHRTH